MRSNFLHWLTLAVVLPAAWALASAAAAKEAAHEFLDKLRDRGYGEVTLDYLAYLKEHQLVPDDVDGRLGSLPIPGLAIGHRRSIQPQRSRRAAREGPNPARKISEGASRLGPGRRRSGPMGDDVAQRGSEAGRSGPGQQGPRAKGQAERRGPRGPRRRQDPAQASGRHGGQAAGRAAGSGRGQKAETRRDDGEAEGGGRGDRRAPSSSGWTPNSSWPRPTSSKAKPSPTTTTEEGKKHRTELLKQAAKAFYDIYQGYRTTTAGLLAHTWEGKTQAALGDQELAQEMYEEVLVLMPDNGTRAKSRPRAGKPVLRSEVFQPADHAQAGRRQGISGASRAVAERL